MTNIKDNLKALGDLGNYELKNDDKDIRNWPLMSEGGREIGRINELLIDRDNDRVAAVRLDNGTTIPVEGLDIQDGHVIDRGAAGHHAAGDRFTS
jgi:hypothetical protein